MKKSENNFNETKQQKSSSAAILDMLTTNGLLCDIDISDKKIQKAEKERKQKMYHNTELMLKHYRNIAWALECFPSEIAEELEKPFVGLDELIGLINYELDMENIRLEQRFLSIQRSRILLDRVNEALSVLKKKPGNGEQLYNIIYQTYIVPEKLTHMEILYRLNISTRHYYRLRQQAINILSIRLWSSPSKELEAWLDILTILEENN